VQDLVEADLAAVAPEPLIGYGLRQGLEGGVHFGFAFAQELVAVAADLLGQRVAGTLPRALGITVAAGAFAVVFVAEQAIEQFAQLALDAIEQGVGLVDLRAELFAQLFDGLVGGALVRALGTATRTGGGKRVVGVVAIGVAAILRMVGRGFGDLLGGVLRVV